MTMTLHSSQQRVAVNVARSDLPTPRARARARQRREQERVAHKKERRIRRRERREQRDKEYRLHEQQGLSPPMISEYSSSGEGEEEESDGGQAPLRGGSLRLPHREPRRDKCLGRAWKCPPLGGLWKRRCAPRRHRRAPWRHPGVL
jgi:hypothetical protein